LETVETETEFCDLEGGLVGFVFSLFLNVSKAVVAPITVAAERNVGNSGTFGVEVVWLEVDVGVGDAVVKLPKAYTYPSSEPM
jgi:hypothetical protein